MLNAPNHQNYRKDQDFYQALRELYGDGLVTSQDQTWMRQRRFIQPLFTPKIVDRYAATMAEEAGRVAAQWRPRPDGVIDLSSEMTQLTLSIAARVLFGEDATRMVPILRAAFPVLGRAVLRRGMSPIRIPLTWPYTGEPADRSRGGAHQCRLRRDHHAPARRRGTRYGPDRPAGGCPRRRRRVVRQRNPRTGEDLSARRSRHHSHRTDLRAAPAGQQPRALAGVRGEAEQTLGSASPTASDIHALTYTTMVLKEATRLYPSAPYMARNAVEESDVCGYRIPAGADVTIATWVIHHRPDLWPDPYRFDPERFSPEAEKEHHKFAWFPFGHGPRGCIGQRFAMLEAAITLATLVREFEFSTPPGEVALTADLLLHPAGEVPSHVHHHA